MRISKAIAFLAPLSLVIACSSGGPGSPTIEGPPGGFGTGGGAGGPVLTPGGGGLGGGDGQGQDAGGGHDSGNPGFDSGTPKLDSGSTGTPDTSTPMYDNYAACVAAFDQINSLPCVTTPLPTSSCSHTKSSCDLTSFYECFGSAYVCTDSGTLDGSAASSCKSTCGASP